MRYHHLVALSAALLLALIAPCARSQSCSGNAVLLDGSNWLDAGSPSSWNLPQTYTLEGWINPAEGSDWVGVFGNVWDTGSTESGIGFQLLSGGLVVFLHRAPFDYTFTGSAPLNRWTHVAGTYDAASGQAALYINGQPVATRGGGAQQVNYDNQRNFMIGRFVDDNEDSKFVGQIAEVRLWSVARSASQISQTWKVPIRQASNLVASWRMAQIGNGWVDDDSGNGHWAGFGGSPQFRTYGCSSADCSAYSSCVPTQSDPGGRLLPDITLDADRLQQSMEIITRTFDSTSCAVNEGCVEGTGARTLLRFETATPNRGTADLVLGDPSGDPRFHYDSCHRHYHYEGYARYLIYDDSGTQVGTGKKMAYCLLDSEQDSGYTGPGPVRDSAQYSCTNQGISIGWLDVYHKDLDCQWIDITNLAPGDYYMNIDLNVDHLFEELDYSNNAFNVSFTVEQPCYPKPRYATDTSGNYAYEDPTTNGHTAASNPSDDGSFSIDLPWSFPYFCKSYSEVWVNSNGFLSWIEASGRPTAHEENTPNLPFPNSICVLWDDHDPTQCGRIYYAIKGSAGSRRLIVTWYQVCHYGSSDDAVTFQVQLHENGGKISMFYPDTDTSSSENDNGGSATVGLGAVLPSDSIRYSYHASPPIPSGTSLVFTVQTQQVNAAPLADINGPYQGYTNVPLKFDSSGSYDPDGWLVEYLWVFGDNTVGQTQANPEHTYAQAGEYDVSLVVHDNYQSSAMAMTKVVIDDQ
jgi:PKD repeat protein